MKKGLLLVLMVLLFASFASANRTRIATMGGNDIFLWDEENIRFCPALAAGYPNEIVAELGHQTQSLSSASLAAFLTNDEIASMGVLGLVVNRDPDFSTLPDETAPGVFLRQDPTFDLVYAKNLGGFGLGMMLTFARNSQTYEAGDTTGTDTTCTSSFIGITPGVTFTLGEKGSVDIGFGLGLNSFKAETENLYGTKDKYTRESDGSMVLEGGLRAMLPMGDYVFLIPYFGFGMGNVNWKYDGADTTYDMTEKGTMFGGGVGLNVMPFEETTVLAGLTFDIESGEASHSTGAWADSMDKGSRMTPALVFGAESRFNSWMTGRVGAKKQFFASESEELYSKDKRSWANDDFVMAIGLGMNFGDFSLDAMLHEDFLFTGPEFVGGSGNPPSVMLSAEYNFSGM